MKFKFILIVISCLMLFRGSAIAQAEKLEEIASLSSYYEKFRAIESVAQKGTRSAAETLVLIVQSDRFNSDLKNKAAWELFDRFLNKDAVEDWVGSNFIDNEVLLNYINNKDNIDWREGSEDIVYGIVTEQFTLSLSKDDIEKGDQDDVLNMSIGGLFDLFNDILKEKFGDFEIRTVQITPIEDGKLIFSSAAFVDNIGHRRTVVYLGNDIIVWDERTIH